MTLGGGKDEHVKLTFQKMQLVQEERRMKRSSSQEHGKLEHVKWTY